MIKPDHGDWILVGLAIVACVVAILLFYFIYVDYQTHYSCNHGLLPPGCSWPAGGGYMRLP